MGEDEHGLYDRKRLDRAFTVSIIALVGFFIPILGIILALVALGINGGVEAHSRKMESRKTTVSAIAVIAIVLSLLAGFVYYSLYKHNQTEAREQAEMQVEAEQNAQQAQAELQAQQEFQRQTDLNNCLSDVDDRIKQATSGSRLTYEDAQLILQFRQQFIDECNQKYAQ